MPKWLRFALILIYVPLYTISLTQWIVNTIYYREQWECFTYRADYQPSIKQQFLYFSMWSLWFSIALLIGWIRTNFSKTVFKTNEVMIWVALPHIFTVFICYIYYDVTNPSDEFLNSEACYTLRKSAWAKQITSNETVINLMLTLGCKSKEVIPYVS
jgi:hypothetical protein